MGHQGMGNPGEQCTHMGSILKEEFGLPLEIKPVHGVTFVKFPSQSVHVILTLLALVASFLMQTCIK